MRWPGRSDPIILGRRYRDTISGWTGVATARYEYMNGCVRIELSGVDKDGKPDGHVFDIQQIELATGAVPVAAMPRGGDRSGRPVDRP